MKRHVCALVFIVALASCGPGEQIAANSSALSPATYSIGNSSTVNTTTGFAVRYVYKEGQLPLKPTGMESTASSWSDVWYVDNGGLCVLGPDGVHGTGDLNRIRFYLYRVNTYGGTPGDYYVAQVDVFAASGAGTCTYWPAVALVTMWPRDHIDMTYAADSFHLIVKNWAGAVTWDLAPVYFPLTSGTAMPNQVHSPMMQIGMDTSEAYGGCKQDVPEYDDPPSDTGHWREHNMFGATAPSFATYVSSPTSNAHCSLTTIHHPEASYDLIQWHQDGV